MEDFNENKELSKAGKVEKKICDDLKRTTYRNKTNRQRKISSYKVQNFPRDAS
jgi:hypothetical protein